MNFPQSEIGSVCFTGHRELSPEECALVAARLPALLRRLSAECRTRDFYAGGALGFDTLAALAVLDLRDGKHLPVSLRLILPCRDQSSRWSLEDRAVYAEILTRADSAAVMSPAYYNGCMLVRDRELVDRADLCVCCLRPGCETGGTAYTVRCAHRAGIPVINLLDPEWPEDRL